MLSKTTYWRTNLTSTNEAPETLTSTVFIKEHTVQSIAINAHDLLAGNRTRVLNTELDNGDELLHVDRSFYGERAIPEIFENLDLHILVLKNEMVVIGHSSPKDVADYNERMGKERALHDAIAKAQGLIAVQYKEAKAEQSFQDNIAEIMHEFIATPEFVFSDKAYRMYPVNLGHALQYILGTSEVNHVLKDTALTLGHMPNNDYMFYGYHQAIEHEDFSEIDVRNFAGLKAIVALSDARVMMAKTKQMKQLEA